MCHRMTEIMTKGRVEVHGAKPIPLGDGGGLITRYKNMCHPRSGVRVYIPRDLFANQGVKKMADSPDSGKFFCHFFHVT